MGCITPSEWFAGLNAELQDAWLDAWNHGQVTEQLTTTLPPEHRPGQGDAWASLTVGQWVRNRAVSPGEWLLAPTLSDFLEDEYGRRLT